MAVKLFCNVASPAARAVMLLLRSLKIPHELQTIDIIKGDQFHSDFKKVNPQHTIPTLLDDGFILWDSHAINAYLVDRYAKDDILYPKDIRKRALINQRLHFDNGVLFPCIRNLTVGVVGEEKLTSVTEKTVKSFKNGYHFVEKFLKEDKYAIGKNITIADYSFIPSLTTMNCIVPIDKQKYPLIIEYLKLCKEQLPFYEEINEEGIEQYQNVLKSHNFKFLER